MTGLRLYPEIREKGIAISGKDPYVMFMRHQSGAASRGIGFKFSFDQWWAIWEPHWANRGKSSLQLCMCRKGDKGDYEAGNVRIATNKENCHERALEWKVSHSQRRYQNREYRTPIVDGQTHWGRNSGAFLEYEED